MEMFGVFSQDICRCLAAQETSAVHPDCPLTVASSNGAPQARQHSWRPAAELLHHTAPVISLAHLAWPAEHPGVPPRHLLFSGATDGGIAVWDVTPAVQAAAAGGSRPSDADAVAALPPPQAAAADAATPPPPRAAAAAATAACSATAVGAAAPAVRASEAGARRAADAARAPRPLPAPLWPPPRLRLDPLAVLPGSHQSGVNALAAAWLDAGELLAAAAAASGGPSAVGAGGATISSRVGRTAVLLSGGDDQVLRAVAIAFLLSAGTTGSGATQDAATVAAAPDGGGTAAAGEAAAHTGVPAAVAVGATAAVPNAHTSALRAVWTNGSRAFSTGLDQRVRCWRLAATPGESTRPDSPGAGAPPGGALPGAAGCSAGDVAAAGAAAVGGGRGASSNGAADAVSGSGGDLAPGMRLVREGASVTQVLEPSCLAVAEAGDGDGRYVVAVAGRGMQLLKYEGAGT